MHLLSLSARLVWNTWRKNFFHQGLAAFTFGILISLGACLVFFSQSLVPVIRDVETRQQVIAFVKPEITEEKENQVVDEIRTTVGSAPKIQWVNRKEFVEVLSKESPRLAEQVYSLGREFDSVVPRIISIEGIDNASGFEALKALTTLESVEWSTHKWKPVVSALKGFYLGALGIGVALWIAAVFGLFQWVKAQRLSLDATLRSIELMGGGWGDRWTPVLLSGLFLGCLAAAFAGLLWLGYSNSFSLGVQSLSPLFAQMLQPPWQMAPVLGVGAVLVSISLTLLGFVRWR